jgi:hypothetical protein
MSGRDGRVGDGPSPGQGWLWEAGSRAGWRAAGLGGLGGVVLVWVSRILQVRAARGGRGRGVKQAEASEA